MKRTRLLTALLTLLAGTSAMAQDENEFQRIAARIMSAYDAGDEVSHAPDSARWYGGAYLGASSQGRAMPSAYATYLVRDRLLLTGNVALDLSERSTFSDVETDFLTGARSGTATDKLTRYEKSDASVRLDYIPARGHILTVGLLESFNHERVDESTIKSGREADGMATEATYEEQARDDRNLKVGGLLQHLYDLTGGGRLTTRANLRYNYKPTDVTSDTWAAHSDASQRRERQTLYDFDPYFMVRYQSGAHRGWTWAAEERYTLQDMRINDTQSRFTYDTHAWFSAVTARYRGQALQAEATGRYELFHHAVGGPESGDLSHTYHDWLVAASATWLMAPRHQLRLTYDRSITRPTYTQLYPFAHIGSSIGVMVVGNASLEPAVHNQVRLAYTYGDSHWRATGSATYKRTDDDITRVSAYDEATQRSVKTWVNDATYDILRLAAEAEMHYGPWSATMGVHAQYLDYDGARVSTDRAWSYSFKARPQVDLPKGWTLASVWLYTGREVHRTYYDRSNMYVSLRAVKRLGDWAIYALVRDILQQDRVQVLTGSDYDMTTTDDLNARALIVGCSYTF